MNRSGESRRVKEGEKNSIDFHLNLYRLLSIYIVFCPGEKRLLESNHLAIEPGGASADSRDVIAAERLIKDPASYIINMAAYNIMPPKILEERASTALAHL